MEESGVHYTSKEMFEDILHKLNILEGKVHTDLQDFARRLVDDGNNTAQRHDKLSFDFMGFERRFALHEQLWHHEKGQPDIARLQSDVEALLAQKVAAEAVQQMLEQAQEQKLASAINRRWLIGLVVTQMLVLSGLALNMLHH